MSTFVEKYFGWFFKQKTAVELHTKFINETTFIAEINEKGDNYYGREAVSYKKGV